ncbi:hypothetical protein D4764_03G0000530 [Takifugu flavidus]|uniref:Uncharacterized protein n=1 Tax=Takifugu flavidus TaxID=433684 RepID=A0A5C6N7F3_9TELE|nr:hypothetical protein D4764_03G0000530 [Takifugu flavidus]
MIQDRGTWATAVVLKVQLSFTSDSWEMYSKGMILASAIRHVRGHGDKFEVATTLRTFIFRAEREGK